MIRKVKIGVTILFDDEEVQPEFFQETTLADVERLMDNEAIGVSTVESMTVVSKECLRDELLKLGNDGSFFDGYV